MPCHSYVKVYSKTSAKNADFIGWVKINTNVYVSENTEFDNNFTLGTAVACMTEHQGEASGACRACRKRPAMV